MATVIGARLGNYINGIFGEMVSDYIYWTDSFIVLHWIRGRAERWKQFVCNRVREVQEKSNPKSWHHCKGIDNPADLLTRGCNASKLKEGEKWFHGPSWLRLEESEWNNDKGFSSLNSENLDDEILVEKRNKPVNINMNVCKEENQPDIMNDVNKISSWTKLRRVFAWCRRFILNCKFPAAKASGCLTTAEIQSTRNSLVKMVQKYAFGTEMEYLQKEKTLPKNSNLLPLAPFLDSSGLLRVGGRLKNSNLSDRRKHPLLLPKGHHLSTIIVRYFHESHLHGTIQMTLSALTQEYWIIGVKNLVRKIISRCVKCHRQNAKFFTQFMSDLPSVRVTPS
ncbi:uncharacterized protein [Parasteatoda tepidariorum]|uniref:uncharacterized protein n=1 Tax=Parasteatoda tepidariorum TaxID=114398 RepID=UPI001C727BFF|nr:uncharacterized protein LOC122269429 [Parasteatoda tepidariorum]